MFKRPGAVTNATELSFDEPLVLETDTTPLLTGVASMCNGSCPLTDCYTDMFVE